MLKNEQSAGAKARQSTEVETQVTSSHNNGNTHVVSSFSSPASESTVEKVIQVMSAGSCLELVAPKTKYCPSDGHKIAYRRYDEIIEMVIADVRLALKCSLNNLYSAEDSLGKTVSIKCQTLVAPAEGQSSNMLSA